MTAGPTILTMPGSFRSSSPGRMRDKLSTFMNTLLSGQADSVCGVEYGTRDPGLDPVMNSADDIHVSFVKVIPWQLSGAAP